MPSNQVTPYDSDQAHDRDEEGKSKHKHRDKNRDNKERDKHDRDDKHRHYHRSSSSKDRDRENDKEREKDREKDRDKSYHRSSSSKDRDKDKEREKDRDKDRDKSYHRSSSSRDRDKGKDDKQRHHHHSSSSKDRGKDRHSSRHKRSHDRKDKYKEEMIIEDIEGDDELSEGDRVPRSRSRPLVPEVEIASVSDTQPTATTDQNASDNNIAHMMSARTGALKSPRPGPSGGAATRRGGVVHENSDETRLNIFFRQASKLDKLSVFVPMGDEPIVESISELLFKPYPFQLKLFSCFICISQFLTLICLFYSLLPCPEKKPSWLVFVGVPLCCAYAGIESIHHMLRYIHLGKGYRTLVCLMILNCFMQLLCVGVVMGKSEGLLDLIGNFVGVAIVLQIDEFLASYIRIKDIDPELLEKKSWRTKMMLKSKIWLIVIAAFIVYGVTLACWRLDSMYCDSYKLSDVDYEQTDPT